jgi:hypothetical protein
VIAEGVIEAGEHFAAAGRIERAAEHTVLDVIEAIVFAYAGDSEPDSVVANIIDNECKQFLPAHSISVRSDSLFGLGDFLGGNGDATEALGAVTAQTLDSHNTVQHEFSQDFGRQPIAVNKPSIAFRFRQGARAAELPSQEIVADSDRKDAGELRIGRNELIRTIATHGDAGNTVETR